jgi:hypothetical protein
MKSAQYQPKTGNKCHCKRGIQRDNCPNCEGTGMQINFAAIRLRSLLTHHVTGAIKRGEAQPVIGIPA